MIYNYDQLLKHNVKFYDSFIDLKVAGWKSYSKSLDDYTNGFYKAQLVTSDNTVDNIATLMKTPFTTIRGICK
jgi:hypothetical protein